jgi:4'-phosphopantetheinyl transferase
MKLYAVKFLRSLDHSLYRSLLFCVDKNKQERIYRFFKWENAHQALLADCLARYAVSKETGLLNNYIKFKTNRFQKPELEGMEGVYFNLSHSGNWVVCAVDHDPVGVDIEKIKEYDPGILEICLSQEEQDLLRRKKTADKQPFFFTLWTLKESYLKALGCGLGTQPKTCSLVFPSNGDIKITRNKKTDFNVFFKSYDIDSGYKMAVCAYHNQFPLSVIIKEPESILEGLNKEICHEQK